jgi:hypothetical protein
MDTTDDNKEKQTKDLFYVSPQGIAFISITFVMIILYAVNPFRKFTISVLKARRYLYLTLMALFLVNVTLFYVYDPLYMLNDYFSIITPVIVGFGVLLFAMVLWYTLRFTNSDLYQSADHLKPTPFTSFFIKMLIMVSSIAISTMLIMWIVYYGEKMSGTSYIFALLLNMLLAVAILGFVYKVLSRSSIIQSSPWLRLFVNVLLYIPCIFVSLIDTIVDAIYKEKDQMYKSDMIISAIIFVLVTLYFLVPYITSWIRRKMLGGKLLLNEPISLRNQTFLGNYLKLNDIPVDELHYSFDYNYAVTMWTYIYATSPSVSGSFTRFTPICDYGGKPTIWYKADENILMITAKLKELTEERVKNNNLDLDEDGNVIVYKEKHLLLQKWNNFIINYDGGTIDVFINGTLVKSINNIVPYMSLDVFSVGASNGINGSVCNVSYYKYTLDALKIKSVYNSVKDDDPPILSYNEEELETIN